MLFAAALLALAGCGTKTPLALPPGPAKPPLLGPASSPAPAPQPAQPAAGDGNAQVRQR